MTPENYKQTVLVCGGYDSFVEEFVLQVHKFVQKGFDVILMEGPGQGDCVRQKIYFKESFELPVASVLDHFGVSSCTMVGISWGEYFALRAAVSPYDLISDNDSNMHLLMKVLGLHPIPADEVNLTKDLLSK